MTRTEIADLIVTRLQANRPKAAAQYANQDYFVVDDLLPEDLAHAVYRSFPDPARMMLRRNLRELKYVSSQMSACTPLLQEMVYAFHDPRVADEVAVITGLKEVEPDKILYAGGISLMGRGHYQHPHLDGSHDRERRRYRLVSLLYYISPDWNIENGGNLELWPQGRKAAPHTIHSKFNRLLVKATNRKSWHSVSKVQANRNRTCVFNHYFSKVSPEGQDFFHVTSFRGRSENSVRDLLLRGETALRSLIRKIVPGGLRRSKHY